MDYSRILDWRESRKPFEQRCMCVVEVGGLVEVTVTNMTSDLQMRFMLK